MHLSWDHKSTIDLDFDTYWCESNKNGVCVENTTIDVKHFHRSQLAISATCYCSNQFN